MGRGSGKAGAASGAATGLLLCILACHMESGTGAAFMDIEGDSAWTRFDALTIVMQRPGNRDDTLFQGKILSLDEIGRLPVEDYHGESVRIVIMGRKNGQLVYREDRAFDGSSSRREVVIDLPFPEDGSFSLDIRPDSLKLWLGEPARQLTAHPPSLWTGRPLAWSTSDSTVARVSPEGWVAPAGAGTAVIRASGGDSLRDEARVSVEIDPPALDVGATDTAILVNSALSFRIRAVQAYGTLAAFAWDLDGDGKYEDSLIAIPSGQVWLSTASRAYPAAGDYVLKFRVRDGEGNATEAKKNLKVTGRIPRISSISAAPALISIQDEVLFSGELEVTEGALAKYAWDYAGDGTADDSGSLSGVRTTVNGRYRYAAAGIHKARLTAVDIFGTVVTGTATVDVRQDVPVADGGRDTSVTASATVRLRGLARDTLGKIARQEWDIGGAGFQAAPTGEISFRAPAAAGEVLCLYRVTDDDGQTAVDTVRVAVKDAGAPALSAVTADTVITIKDSVAFSAAAEAVGGAALKTFSWDFDGDGTAEIAGDLGSRSAVIRGGRAFPVAGDFKVILKVYDADGIAAEAVIRVTVKQDAPTAYAGDDTTVAAGTLVHLHGKEVDSLGTIVKREWRIGKTSFRTVSKGDTSFIAPETAGILECYYRVTDDDGQVSMGLVNVVVAASADAELSGLDFDYGSIPFAPSAAAYTLRVADTVPELKVTPTARSGEATITVNGMEVESGAASGPIAIAQAATTPITVKVTAGNGTATRTYTVNAKRNGWVPVGTPGFSHVAAGAVALALGTGNLPTVAYANAAGAKKLSVMSWNGTAWAALGAKDFSLGEAKTPSLAMSGNAPYVVYLDPARENRASVMYYDGNGWAYADSARASAAYINFYPSIKIEGSAVSIAYTDNSKGGKATAQVLSGGSWVPYGDPGFTPNAADLVKFDQGHVAYRANDGSNALTVYKWYNAWSRVGPINIATEVPDYVNEMDFLVWGGNPVVAYTSVEKGFKLYCKVYDALSNAWKLMVPESVSPTMVNYPKLRAGNGGLYLAFRDASLKGGARASVMKQAGTAGWQYLGAPGGISSSDVDDIGFAAGPDESSLYVAFADKSQFGKVTVMKYLAVP